MPRFFLGIDVSTTATKALVMDERGQVVAIATTAYAFETPRPLWSEQSPELFWDGAIKSIQAVLQRGHVDSTQIAAVGLAGQMHGLVLLDAYGKPLRPCILWNDQRTVAQVAFMNTRVGKSTLLQLTGNPAITGFTAPKLLWVREHEPQTYEQIGHVLLPKDYVRYRLTGEFLSDVSDASGTALFNVGKRAWSDEMLRTLEIPRSWLPDITESPIVSATIDAEGARATGLAQGTPVVAGAGDQAAQAVGTGVVRAGTVSVTLGTSGVVFAPTQEYRMEPEGRLHAFCHAVPNMWHVMGVMLSAGASLRWCRDVFGKEEIEIAAQQGKDAYDLLTEQAELAPPGCEGLIFLPYLAGERAPHPDPNARGVFFGLSLRHGKAHLTRSVLEGVTFGLRDSLELLRALGIKTGQVQASGGGARSRLWRQILADVFDAEIVTVGSTEGAAYGSAILASVGVGAYADVPSACDSIVQLNAKTQPGDSVNLYTDYYLRFRSLYPALAGEFQELGRLVARTEKHAAHN